MTSAFFAAHGVGVEGNRRLHGGHRQKLEHVVRHHVAQRAGCLVELAPVLDADGLGRRDLHMVDVLAISISARTIRWRSAAP